MSDNDVNAGTPVSRRSAVAGIGAVAVAGAGLAGCTRYGGEDSTSGDPDQPAKPDGTVLGNTADIPVGGGAVFADERVVVTQPVAGQFKCFSAVCTHQGCVVAAVADGTINCPCHGSKFAVADGVVAGGPAPKPLAAKQISVSDSGEITLGEPAEQPTSDTSEPDQASSPPETSTEAAAPGLASTADIPVGGGTVFADERVVVTQPVAGQFKCFSAVCTHQGCVVAAVAGGTINCPCHGSKFAVADGSVASGPAQAPLPARKLNVNGDQITLA